MSGGKKMREEEKIRWEDLEKVDIRSGKIVEEVKFKEERKNEYKIKIDFGEKIGIKKQQEKIKRK